MAARVLSSSCRKIFPRNDNRRAKLDYFAMAKILIAEDDAAFRASLAETIVDLGHESIAAASGEEALTLLEKNRAALALVDLRMRGMDGLEVLRRIKSHPAHGDLPVVILTAFADSANTIEAMKLGAFDHLTKPIGRDDLAALLSRALARPRMHAQTAAPAGRDDELIGFSSPLREVQKLIGVAAASDASVLVFGETGTGKELVARAIHQHSQRARRPFVPANCAAIPSELLESELFGHVRGAFTGALASRAGRFREAGGGTLFLDEIGDMSLSMQAKLLRVLQDGMITPVGGGSAEKVNVRIIAATHRDLVAMVREEKFREDLFYRLNVLAIALPSLRERGADILVLAEHFLQRAAPDSRKKLSSTAAKALLEHSWPGNVRELENVMRKLSLTVRTPVIDRGDLQFDVDLIVAAGPNQGERDLLDLEFYPAIAKLERMLLQRALAQSAGNRAEAARRLGINRQLLYAKLKEHGLEH
jgi:two-component system NtrC family response regulator